MNYLDVLLLAEARQQGRAQRSATLCHRHLTRSPMALALWQLGAEPFTAAAVAWGTGPKKRRLVVPGEPRNRDLAFHALAQVAHDFNPWFEAASGKDSEAPQLLLANAGALSLLGRLGRRLAFLSTEGAWAADPALVRFGRHLLFLHQRARHPGQQLVLVLTELLASHWVSELSPLEAQSLPALDAVIEPPKGRTGHEAACEAEKLEIGPVPGGDDDSVLEPLVSQFNRARGRHTDEATVAPLRAPIESHYTRLVDRSWKLLWRCLERERQYPEAPHVQSRWESDRDALARHLDFLQRGGRMRSRDTHRAAAWMLRWWEDAQRLLVAQEAIDDPLRMVPFLLSNEALVGKVVAVDLTHEEQPNIQWVRRPLFVLETTEPCLLPLDKELYWSRTPDKAAYVVCEVQEVKKRGVWRVTLKHETSAEVPRPRKGEQVIFSVHHTHSGPPLKFPEKVPWTHQKAEASGPEDIETGEEWS